jgi:hypothetical protein
VSEEGSILVVSFCNSLSQGFLKELWGLDSRGSVAEVEGVIFHAELVELGPDREVVSGLEGSASGSFCVLFSL